MRSNYLISVVVLALVSVFVAPVLAEGSGSELPEVRRITSGETIADIAKELGVTVSQLQQWNRLNRTGLLNGEVLFTAPPPDDQKIQRWSIFGGDPAGDSLRYQIPRFVDRGIAEDLVQLFKSQEEATVPWEHTFVSTPENPLILQALAFGGKRAGSEPKTWGPTACYWVRKHTDGTLENINQAEALVYPKIEYEGYEWQLVQFVECGNGAVIRYELEPEPEPEPEPIVTPPPPPTLTPAPVVTETPVDESVSPSVPMPPRPARDWRRRGVLWVDGYRYEFNPDGKHQWSFFTGAEMAFRIGRNSFLGMPKFAVVPRVEQFIQAIDRNRFSKGGDYGGNYSLGAEFHLLQRNGFIVRPQAGVGYTYQQRSRYSERIEDGNRIKERRRYNFGDTWWYVRPNMSGPYRSYAEYYIRRDFVHDSGFNFTIEPGRLYVRYGWGRTTRGGQSTYDMIAGQRTKVSWPGDYYRVSQAKLGVNITQDWLSYLIWEDQVYKSAEWYANSPNGYGFGTQYYFVPNRFRVVVEGKHWPNYDTVDRGWERVLASQNVPAGDVRWSKARTHGNRQEFHAGLVWNW